jgi:DNA-binding NtrC family response regulator
MRLELGDRAVVIADPAMVRLYELIRRLARSQLPVLITGETGTGKEIAAALVHHGSPRASGPLVRLSSATLPETLVESELFGYEKGAFTGATAAKPGLLEAASGGTVFLDEVGELPLAVQAKLLRALEARSITRLGDLRERAVDFRLVAATNRDLDEEVRAGRFRQDLYFRLSAATVVLPPLRDRPREVPLLARTFLAEACTRAGRSAVELSPASLQALSGYAWPGNVRELRHAMEYAVATAPAVMVIEPWHLPARVTGAASGGVAAAPAPASEQGGPPRFRPVGEELRELEKRRMAEALAAADGVRVRAAELIGMPLRTFVQKLKQYGLGRARERER